jgi:LPXTG-site transpeptidase (sortase) family protein
MFNLKTNNKTNPTTLRRRRVYGFLIFLGLCAISLTIFALSDKDTTDVDLITGTTQKQVQSAEASQAPEPFFLSIPSLEVTASFEPLGLNSDRTLEVPKNNMGVGWYIGGAKPGEVGASVVVGHVDSPEWDAIFANLHKIKAGDKIYITRADESVVTYTAESMSVFPQDNFPTQTVY